MYCCVGYFQSRAVKGSKKVSLDTLHRPNHEVIRSASACLFYLLLPSVLAFAYSARCLKMSFPHCDFQWRVLPLSPALKEKITFCRIIRRICLAVYDRKSGVLWRISPPRCVQAWGWSHSLGDTPMKSCIQGAFHCVEGTARYLVQQVLQLSDINWTLIGFGS